MPTKRKAPKKKTGGFKMPPIISPGLYWRPTAKQIAEMNRKRGGNLGLLWNVIPPNIKRQLGVQLVKDLTTKVALPIAGLVGTKKLHSHYKKKK